MGTKNNPGKFDCHAKAGSDEPIFTLHAKDPLAPMVIMNWIERRIENNGGVDDEKTMEAYQCITDMMFWREKNID